MDEKVNKRVVKMAKVQKWGNSLVELCSRITEKSEHDEMDFGKSKEKEI